MEYIFLVITAALFVAGSFGIFREISLFLMIASLVSLVGLTLAKKGKIKIPKHFGLYSLFVCILLIHYIFVGGKLIFFWLFFSGLLIWLVVYNFKSVFLKYFYPGIIFLSLALGFLYFYSKIIGLNFLPIDSLFLPLSETTHHNHIGDFWALSLIVVFSKIKDKLLIPTKIYLLLGVFFLLISNSRSAILSLLVGSLYLLYESTKTTRTKDIIKGTLFVSLILFIIVGASKTTLFARPYFLPAIFSLFEHPLGVGMGNFGEVGSSSNLVHNLILEIVAGMGIFSFVFILWLGRIILYLKRVGGNNPLFVAIFLALFVNFSFDTTYIIPAMVWFWFLVLGLS